MSDTPQITLTATLDDICGAAAGTTASPAVLRIALAGFGRTLPCIAGTANIARVGPEDFYDIGSGIEIELWGNDVITPAGTYYAITVLDGDGNIVQCAAYQFSGTDTVDLSEATPYNPPPPAPGGYQWAFSEVPGGDIDGTNAVFTLAHTPSPAAGLQFFKNGARMTAYSATTSDIYAFTLDGATITYEPDYIPEDGDSHIAGSYLYLA